jgi:hypothetical protein
MKKLLTEISIVWTDDDVRTQAENDGIILSKKEISNVLSLMENGHDATIGINWDTISFYIQKIIEERK